MNCSGLSNTFSEHVGVKLRKWLRNEEDQEFLPLLNPDSWPRPRQGQLSTLCAFSSLRAPGLTLRDSVHFGLTSGSGQFILFHLEFWVLKVCVKPFAFYTENSHCLCPRPEGGRVHPGALLTTLFCPTDQVSILLLMSHLRMLPFCESLTRAWLGIVPFLYTLLGS